MRAFVSTTLTLLVAAAVVFPAPGLAQDKAAKVAIINIQAAIAQCNEGQEAAKALQSKFQPKRAELEREQREINDLQGQLKNQEKTLSDDARNKLLRSIDDKTRIFNRDNEDATTEFQQAEQDAINEIGRKMIAVISDHAKKNSFSVVLDVSSPQTPVLYADMTLDITEKIIEAFNATGKPASTSAAPVSPSAAPKPATAPKPAAEPAKP